MKVQPVQQRRIASDVEQQCTHLPPYRATRASRLRPGPKASIAQPPRHDVAPCGTCATRCTRSPMQIRRRHYIGADTAMSVSLLRRHAASLRRLALPDSAGGTAPPTCARRADPGGESRAARDQLSCRCGSDSPRPPARASLLRPQRLRGRVRARMATRPAPVWRTPRCRGSSARSRFLPLVRCVDVRERRPIGLEGPLAAR